MSTELELIRQDPDGFLRDLMSSETSVSAVIPSDAPADQIVAILRMSGRAFNDVRRAYSRLRPIIGRLLVIVKNRPEIYKDILGFKTYEDFLDGFVAPQFGLTRTNAYAAARMVTKWPNLSLTQYEKIGSSNIDLISRFADESSPNGRRYMELAESGGVNGGPMPYKELSKVLAEQGLVNKQDVEMVAHAVWLSKDTRDMFKKFLSNPAVRAVTNSKTDDDVIVAMVAECMSSWADDIQRASNPSGAVIVEAPEDPFAALENL